MLTTFIGCGNGKYMQTNSQTFNIGVDRCSNLATSARQKGNEVGIGNIAKGHRKFNIKIIQEA